MRLCDLTLPAPEENLACDDALLDLCEAGKGGPLLRFWEPIRYFVVLGYANPAETEVDLPFCAQNTIPVLRRCTGGGTVLQGPGCLNYSLVLDAGANQDLATITGANEFIMSRHQQAFTTLLQARVEKMGHTDLAIGGLKFSGNAQRRKRRFLLFHGSFLLHMDIELIEKALRMPSRQPDYRANRSHTDFLVNLRVPAQIIKAALTRCWQATEPMAEIPVDETAHLMREKYSRPEWNFKF